MQPLEGLLLTFSSVINLVEAMPLFITYSDNSMETQFVGFLVASVTDGLVYQLSLHLTTDLSFKHLHIHLHI